MGDRLKGEAMLRRYGTILIVAGCACIVAVVVISLPRDIGARIVDEQGPIEQASWIGYVSVALLAILVGGSGRLADGVLGAVVLLALAARELDSHVRFTTLGVLKLRFWTSAETPVNEKLVAGLILAGIVMATVWLLVRNFNSFKDRLAAREAWAINLVAALLLLPCVKIVDRALSLFKEWTASEASENLVFASQAFEETFELAIPVLLIVSVIQLHLVARSKPGLERAVEE